MNTTSVSLTVNGRAVALDVPARTHLADALREEEGLTGTHLGCEQGVCGACTIVIDGAPQRGCLTLAASCDGATVTTIEGFDNDPIMADLRESFSTHHGLQCGYCTPGMLITAHDIIRRLPDANEARIRQELAGNLCRCTGYVGIVKAIQASIAAFPADHPSRLDHALGEEMVEALPSEHDMHRAEPVTTKQRSIAGAVDEKVHHHLDLEMAPSDLWARLVDVENVAACFPGAELSEIKPGDDPNGPHQLCGHVAVALGPMKARFSGQGEISFDPSEHKGSLSGEGADRNSRSHVDGIIDFQVQPRGQGSRLLLSIGYNVTGPLAQFSRGALVDDLVQSMLHAFGENVVHVGTGGPAASSSELKAMPLLLDLARRRLVRWLEQARKFFQR